MLWTGGWASCLLVVCGGGWRVEVVRHFRVTFSNGGFVFKREPYKVGNLVGLEFDTRRRSKLSSSVFGQSQVGAHDGTLDT